MHGDGTPHEQGPVFTDSIAEQIHKAGGTVQAGMNRQQYRVKLFEFGAGTQRDGLVGVLVIHAHPGSWVVWDISKGRFTTDGAQRVAIGRHKGNNMRLAAVQACLKWVANHVPKNAPGL